MNTYQNICLACMALMLIFTGCQDNSAKIIRSEFIFQSDSVPFKECHASTLVELKGGDILSAWFAGSHEGNKDVQIWASKHSGERWTEPYVIADGRISDTLSYPCWNPVLFRTNNGVLYLYYKVGPNPQEWWGMYKTSGDEGQTWSAAQQLPDGILGPIKNKPLQLDDGTILSPSSTETETHWRAHIELSQDDGKTWTVVPIDHESSFNVIQPSILQHENGRLQVLCRSKEGSVVQSWSNDNGRSWTNLSGTQLINPNSATDAIRLENGKFLIVYNPDVPGKDWWNGRAKLRVALSDDGIEWEDVLSLEDGEDEEFSYPSVIQASDGQVHLVYTYDRKQIKHVILAL